MMHLFSTFFFIDNTRYIKDLLDRFEDPRSVPNWSNQALILLDYLDITAKVRHKKNGLIQITLDASFFIPVRIAENHTRTGY